jgi:hypothetical protein
MGLISVLAEAGSVAPRPAPGLGWKGRDAGVDAAAGLLADASLLRFTIDDSVVAHRLVMRVVRERLAAGGGLNAAVAGAVRVLRELDGEIVEAWRDSGGARELADHVEGHRDASVLRDASLIEVSAKLLRLRLDSAYLLGQLGG